MSVFSDIALDNVSAARIFEDGGETLTYRDLTGVETTIQGVVDSDISAANIPTFRRSEFTVKIVILKHDQPTVIGAEILQNSDDYEILHFESFDTQKRVYLASLERSRVSSTGNPARL